MLDKSLTTVRCKLKYVFGELGELIDQIYYLVDSKYAIFGNIIEIRKGSFWIIKQVNSKK